jgi:hypothetical protein
MKPNRFWSLLLAGIFLLGLFTAGPVVVHGTYAGRQPFPIATDWSHRHLVFSPPKSLMGRFRFSSDYRYVQQWVRRNAERRNEEEDERERERHRERRGHIEDNLLHDDWNVYVGNAGTVGPGEYPAKFSFDVTVANCGSATPPDFVAWNTNLAGSASPVAAEDIGTFSAAAGGGSTVTITNGAKTLTMSAAGINAHLFTIGNNSFGTFSQGGSAAQSATGLAGGISASGNGDFVGVSATSAGTTVTVTASTAGTAGNSIAVAAQTASNLTWTFSNLVDGATGVPSIVAFDNLYSSCTGTVPSPYWAYNTGGTVRNSVALSLDGKQLAFVQSQGSVANLVILKWAASSGAVNTPVNLSTQTTAAAYRSCTAPCMYTIAFSGGRDDSNSAPYYDPETDTVYVGDDPATRGVTNSALHKFTGVFNGNPAEVVTGGWPVTLGVEILTSPVYDDNDGQTFVADSNTSGSTTGGFLYKVDGSTGTVVKSARLAEGGGFVEGPVVDPVNGTVYLYSSSGGTTGCPSVSTTNEVFQMAASFTSGAGAATSAQVSTAGTCSSTLPLYAGDFDNAYYSGGAGNLYVCGNIGGNPTLYQINVSSTGALVGTPTTGPTIASATTTCSPVVEFFNPNAAVGGKDWIFLSTQNSAETASPISCPAASGCLVSFDVTSGAAISAITPTAARTTVAGGASGVVFDNFATATGDSQVYFTPLAAGTCTTSPAIGIGGCAIQASQSGLM